jgi:hypothetical protein
MGSLDLRNRAVFCCNMCTDMPLVPARLPPPICLVVPAWHSQCACLKAPYCPAILLAVPSRHPLFSEGWLYALTIYTPYCMTHTHGGHSVSATISFALTVPSVLLHDALRVVSEKLLKPPNLGSPFY